MNEPLIGRTHELALLKSALDAQRIVAITGVTGVGKSNLARALPGSKPGPVDGEKPYEVTTNFQLK